MRKLKLGVLISGSGTNLQALIDAAAQGDYPAEINVVICNRPNAGGIERAKKAGIPVAVIDHTEYEIREKFEAALQECLMEHGVQLVCLAGFMRILNADFVNKWRDRMINIHPSLLPAYKGLHTHARALEDGVRFAGCTIHFVRPEMDNGPIIMQAAIPILPVDTPESLAARTLTFEHQMYPAAVRLIAEGKVRVSGHKVVIKEADIPPGGMISPVP
ncbi:phosphoribosylglycinamide formyltransferase [Kordiimonas sediminis]|uniref:Phosphoribosylglycinamide formyltransferase n=1 Tax=Kordiimonas sediminis TaxID=1735581 RepID=A0A919E9N9_9PROT|nr:phosphoribosylglycinamide formyltransferase [Kordiimonas sediminis]GHF27688.1 phosphoribosylglycinamide formyltransferase [Kordiimonas sediminis]